MNLHGLPCFLLDAHLPLVRHPGKERVPQEDWVFRAFADCYVPLLQMLARLDADGVPGALTVAVSPTLVTMWDDGALCDRFEDFLRNRIQRCHEETDRFSRADSDLGRLAGWQLTRSEMQLDFFQSLPKRNITSALAEHCRTGRVELIPSVSSYVVLPLISDPIVRRAHLRLTATFFERRFGFRPHGVLLPACAYSPDLDDDLLSCGFAYTFASAMPFSSDGAAPRSVGVSPSGLILLRADYAVGQQLFSISNEWTNDHVYRASDLEDLTDHRPGSTRPHMCHAVSRLGFHYYQRARAGAPWSLYEPANALERARQSAIDFVDDWKNQGPNEHGDLGVVASDAELYGYRWFEGFWYLEHLFRHAEQRVLPIVSPFGYLASEQPIVTRVVPTVTSAGSRGFFEDWLNEKTIWVYRSLEVTQSRLRATFQRFADTTSPRMHRILAQGARELVLAQASDWLLMITRGGNAQYAIERLQDHLTAADGLASLAERRGRGDRGLLARRESAWPLFPELDFRVFAEDNETSGEGRSAAAD